MGESNKKFFFLLKVVFLQSFFLLLFLLIVFPNEKETTSLSVQAQEGEVGIPVRLKIPKIDINSAVTRVGVAESGEMDSPSNPDEAGWFELGIRPGSVGSSVIAGHFDDKNGEDGVFRRLGELKSGDVILVEDDKGESLVFVVNETKLYDPGQAEEVFSQSDGKHLNLITCDGAWDKTKKSYSKRLVVFAEVI